MQREVGWLTSDLRMVVQFLRNYTYNTATLVISKKMEATLNLNLVLKQLQI